MTILTQTDRNIYSGNGATLVFPYTFPIIAETDMTVTLIDADGVETLLILSTDYTVTGEGTEAGGNVTLLGTAPAAGVTILLLRAVPYTQPTDLKNQGSFYPLTYERMVDRLEMQIQQLKNGLDLALVLPPYITGASAVLPAPEASELVGWDETATRLRNYSLAEIATGVAYGDMHYDVFPPASVGQTDFTLTADPGSLGNLDVSVDGVTQVNGVDFTYLVTTLTFTTPMAGGEVVLARYGEALPTGVTNASAVSFIQAGTGAVTRTAQDKLRDAVSVKDFGATGDGATDDTSAIQNAVNFGIAYMPPGVYCVSSEIVIPDGCGLIGASAFWKRRTGYVYDPSKQSVLKYVGAGGANTCVVRASAMPVGTKGVDFSGPDTDDLVNIALRNFHVDANGLADYGVYVYRAGNQATISHLTAAKAVEANHVHLGCFAAQFGVFGAYESENEGVVCGWDIFAWGATEATNFAYTAHFKTANNGTAGTYAAGTATDLEGSGGRFSVGRGSRVTITSEGNDGRACVLSQLNITSGAGGPSDYVLEYLEGNADGPYVDYRDGMDAIRLRNGFLHPGNGSTLLPQNITIEGKNNSGVVTPDSGPADRAQWLVIDGFQGDLSGTGIAIDSNTYKMIVRDCARNFTFPDKFPQTDDYIPSENQVGAGVYFTASASPSVWKATNGTLARVSTGIYNFTLTRPFKTGTLPIPALSLVLTAALDTRVRITSISATLVTIRTYDNAGNLADTGDRVSCLLSGILAYQ